MNLLKALASLAIVLCIGYTFPLFLFRGKSISFSRRSLFSLGFGFSLLTEIYLLFFAFSSKIKYSVIYIILFFSLLLVLYSGRRFSFRAVSDRFGEFWKNVRANSSASKKFISYSVLFLGIAICGILSFNLLARPAYQFDSRAIWMYKAKIIYQEGTIFSDAVLDQSRNHPHPRYPLLLPVAASWIFSNLQESDDRSVRILFLLFFAGLMLATYELQRLESTITASALACLALLVIPFTYSGTRAGPASGYADLILSFYIASGTMAMALWLKEKSYPYLLAGSLTAAGGALVKNEGLIFAANLLICTIIFSFRDDEKETSGSASLFFAKKNTKSILLVSLSVLMMGIFLLPWLSVRSRLPQFLDENYMNQVSMHGLTSAVNRMPEVAKGLVYEFGNLRNWLIAWVLIGIAICGLFRKRGRIPSFVLAVMVVQLLSYAGIFLITPNDPVGQMRDALPRLLFQILPLGVALVSFHLSER